MTGKETRTSKGRSKAHQKAKPIRNRPSAAAERRRQLKNIAIKVRVRSLERRLEAMEEMLGIPPESTGDAPPSGVQNDD